ncbi:hypothetical protein HFN89_03315 [Rhizobium laguerreae]|nr:hypothetical protein [Rhizobium laguerreae]
MAIGFAELGHTLDESIDQITGDPMICASVQRESVRDALKDGIDLVSRVAFNSDVPTNATSNNGSGRRLIFRRLTLGCNWLTTAVENLEREFVSDTETKKGGFTRLFVQPLGGN